MQSTPTPSAVQPGDTPRVLTRQDADQLSVYEAVNRWLNREPSFMHEDDPEHHLEELALMTMAADWLTRWQPITIHRALLAGATPKQAADAAGLSVGDVYEQWHQWADLQRRSLIAGHPGITEEAFKAVRARFATR